MHLFFVDNLQPPEFPLESYPKTIHVQVADFLLVQINFTVVHTPALLSNE